MTRSLARLFVLAALAAPALHAQSAEFTRIDAFNVSEINNAASILVGTDRTGGAFGPPARWDRGVIRLVEGIPDGLSVTLRGVSTGGETVLGTWGLPGPAPFRFASAFITPDGFRQVGPDGFEAGVLSVTGRFAGGALRTLGSGNPVDQAAVWDDSTGALALLPFSRTGHSRAKVTDVSATGVVRVGDSQTPGSQQERRAVRWDGEAVSEAPVVEAVDGNRFQRGSFAVAVSADGRTVLGYTFRDAVGGGTDVETWLWTPTSFQVLPFFPGSAPGSPARNGQPRDISADGSVVLAYCPMPRGGGFDGVPCTWTEADGWTTLVTLAAEAGATLPNDILWTADFTALRLTADGQTIVGNARDGLSGPTFAYRFGIPVGSPLVINDTGDGADADPGDQGCDADLAQDGDQCTLRAAIDEANRRSGRDSVSVRIDGNGPHQIVLGSALPDVTEPLVLDATTQPGYAGTPRIVLTGSAEVGIGLVAGESTVRGFAIGGFATAGIGITGPGGNRVEACHLGVDASGTAALANGVGVFVTDSPDNTIGGEEPTQRNVISGNTGAGVLVVGESATGTVVSANFIGVSATGAAALANGAEGVRVEGAPDARIGGASAGERNVISGNTAHGVYVKLADGAQIQGNYIGTNAAGNAALGNGTDTNILTGHRGVLVEASNDVTIGGPTATPGAAPGNVIAASAVQGIYVDGDLGADGPSDDLQVLGNLVGLDAAGQALLANGDDAIVLRGAVRSAHVGQVGGGNVVATGEEADGIVLYDLGTVRGTPTGPTIAANTLGLTATGSAPLGAMVYGIRVNASANPTEEVRGLTIGGESAAEGNRISADAGIGVAGTPRAFIAANTVGLLANGALARTELDAIGIQVLADSVGVASNTVGGQILGIIVQGRVTKIAGNFIGTDPTGTSARPNTIGIWIPGTVTNGGGTFFGGDDNVVGGEGLSNVISGNTLYGLRIGGHLDLGGSSRAGTAPSSDALRAAAGSARFAARGLSRESSASRAAGPDADRNVVLFNQIGTNAAGTQQIGNGRTPTLEESGAGVYIQGGQANVLLANRISGNGIGVAILPPDDFSSQPEATALAANLIGLGVGLSAIPNQHGGVYIQQSNRNVLTDAPLEEGGEPIGNVIANNGRVGVYILSAEGDGLSNEVRRNNFLGNDGPSIERINGDDPTAPPPGVPEPPGAYRAIIGETAARILIRPKASGPLDFFVSDECRGGNAEGRYVASEEGTAGTALNASLSYDVLGTSGPSEALGQYLSVTQTTPGVASSTSAFSECVRIARPEDVAEVEIGDGETGPVLGDPIEIEITENGGAPLAKSARTGGTLYAARYGEQIVPQPGPIEGSAIAPDGSTVAPNAVSSNRYWTLTADGLAGVTYSACLDISGVGGVTDPAQLVVLHRESAGHAWTPFDSSLDGSRLCTAGLTAWGDLGIGGDSLVNPVPGEPGPPEAAAPSAFALTAYPNPSRGATTVSLAVPEPGHVRAEVLDALGRRVAVLQDGPLAAGTLLLRFDPGGLPAGVYVVRATAGPSTLTQRLTVVR